MLAHANRITQADDYRAVVRRGKRFVAPNTVIYIRTPPAVLVDSDSKGKLGTSEIKSALSADTGLSSGSGNSDFLSHPEPIIEPNSYFVAPRFGLIVAKTVGIAVKRNLVRRRMKALCFAALPEVKPGYDIVIRALPGASLQPFAVLRDEITESFRQGRVLV